MFKNYYIILQESFKNIPLVNLIFLCAFLISLILISLIIILILLDQFYRPNIPQYPFNFWLDRFIPIIFLICPSIISILISPSDSLWFERLLLLLFLHIFILVPLLYYWSNLRNWDDSLTKTDFYKSWNHPRLYFHIALAVIYPTVWGIYFSTLRYLRLGNTLDIYNILFYNPYIYIPFIFLLPHLFLWLLLFLHILTKVRLYLWSQVSSLLYSIHLFLLTLYPYFYIMEKVHKFHHLIYSYILLSIRMYNKDFINKASIFRKFLHYLYINPMLLTVIFIFTIIIEIIVSQGMLYYGLYTLFYYPLFRESLILFSLFGNSDWTKDCCFSDYVYRKWTRPHYPFVFWYFFDVAHEYYGFSWHFTEEQLTDLSILAYPYQWRSRKVSYSTHTDQLLSKVINRSWCTRMAALYRKDNQIRFVHTQVSRPLHSATAYFARTIWEKVALVNHSWKHYTLVQKAQSIHRTPLEFPGDIYISIIPSMKADRFETFIEQNTITHFVPLIKENVVVSTFNNHVLPYYVQTRPDVVFDFKDSTFVEKGIHGLDMKTTLPGVGRSMLLPEISVKVYQTTIDRFSKEMDILDILTNEGQQGLNLLKETCCNFDTHQIVWANNIHYFPKDRIPPLRLKQNFNTDYLLPEMLKAFKDTKLKMIRISNLLYVKKNTSRVSWYFPIGSFK